MTISGVRYYHYHQTIVCICVKCDRGENVISRDRGWEEVKADGEKWTIYEMGHTIEGEERNVEEKRELRERSSEELHL